MTAPLESVTPASAPRVNVLYVDGVGALDKLVFQEEDVYTTTGSELNDLRLDLIGDSFRFHYESCAPFRRYCESMAFSPRDLVGYPDLLRIPLLPTSLFKKRELLSVPPSEVSKVCVSSGTQGGQSRVHRNKQSLERLLGSVRQGLSVLDRDVDRDRRVFVLGPDTEEAQDLWFAYVLSVIDLLQPTLFYVRDSRFECDLLLEHLEHLGEGPQPLLVGPPFLLAELAQTAVRLDRRVDLARGDGLVITAGGWKRHEAEALSRDVFDSLVADGLGVPSSRVRDTFNMVELNSVFFECEERRKHVPPWVLATARDATTLAPVGPNVDGLLAYCDPLATSYPCFILTDDIGVVSDDELCPCGRFGNTVTLSRRVARVEARGCALKMDRALAPRT